METPSFQVFSGRFLKESGIKMAVDEREGQVARKRILQFVYFVCVFCIAGASLFVYGAWWKRYLDQRPDLVVAKPYVHSDQVPVEVVLLWREQVVHSPFGGRVRYPEGPGPFYAAGKDTVAMIDAANGKTYALTVESPGYFVAGLDGMEGRWGYNTLWQGMSRFPKVSSLKLISEGAMLEKGDPVGKIVYQPQPLRALAYLEAVSGLEEEIASHRLYLKKSETALPFEAEIRAVKSMGKVVKMYLTLPFFPESLILSRKENYLLYLGERKGVVIPESAVFTRSGKLWVYHVEGDTSRSREIRGMPLQKGRFLVTSGLSPGETVLAHGEKDKEGVIRIW